VVDAIVFCPLAAAIGLAGLPFAGLLFAQLPGRGPWGARDNACSRAHALCSPAVGWLDFVAGLWQGRRS